MSAKINFEIIGNKELTDVYSTEDITVAGKVERNLTDVVTGDGWISIPISKIGTISKIIVNSTSANLRIGYNESDPSSIIIPINGLFVYSVLATFADTITSIDIATDNTQVTDIDVTVIGV